MDKNFIVLWAAIFISFVLGMLCERMLTKKDGQLKVDMSGEKDVYILELWCPLEGIEKRKRITLKINDISNVKKFEQRLQ